jgi:hypothetical protein
MKAHPVIHARLIAGVLLCTPLLVRSQDATTQPVSSADPVANVSSDPQVNPPISPAGAVTDEPRNRRRWFQRPGPRALQGQLTEKEFEDARTFMQQHSPQRLKALEAMPDGEEKTRIRDGAAQAYLNWMRLANTDFPLYAVVEKRVELEDQIFGKYAQLRSDPPEKQDGDKADLKDLVTKLVDNGIKERELRLQKLKRAVEAEQKSLDYDSANRPKVVDDRFNAILNSDGGGLLPNAGPGPGGPEKRPRPIPRGN